MDNGGGHVIGSELLATKHAKATANLSRAGLSDVTEVRLGDAMTTLKETPAPIDLVFLDGWKDLYLPVLKLLKPRIRAGALVLARVSADYARLGSERTRNEFLNFL